MSESPTTIAFLLPPPDQRRGGIDLAVDGLRAALEACGVRVMVDPAEPEVADAYHFHGIWQPGHARFYRFCAERGVRYFVSPHGMLEPWARRSKWWKKKPYYLMSERRHLRGAAGIFATGAMERQNLLALLPRCAPHSIPLGLDTDPGCDYAAARAALGWAEGERVLLFLSRIDRKKGLDLLLRALVSLPERDRASLRLAVVGDGDARLTAALQRFCAARGGALPRIDWVGPVWGAEKWRYLQGADLFVLPSHSENFGLAVLEALRVGTPVLTSDATPWVQWGGREDICIVPPRVDRIASGIRTCLQCAIPRDEREREATRRWSRETFDWAKLAADYLSVYRGAGGSPAAGISAG